MLQHRIAVISGSGSEGLVSSYARAKKLARAAGCLSYSLTLGGGFGWQDDENQRSSRVSAALCVSKMPERTRTPEVSTRLTSASQATGCTIHGSHTGARGA